MNTFLVYVGDFSTIFSFLIIVTIIITYLFGNHLKTYHSHWNTLLDNFEYSSKEFYSRLKVELESHGITNITIEEAFIKEGGALSYSRIYLRATWKQYEYNVCGAKFGKGFFISWWLMDLDSVAKRLISKIPFIGTWLNRQFFPVTFYTQDTASMFMTYAQNSVLKVIEEITNNKGVRSLSELERKPVLNSIFKR
nr:hypothetical protein [uncultured Psychroserpens sp.]